MQSWNQCHGNGANQGLMPINTRLGAEARWQVELGAVSHSSPVIGNDGVIYIGLSNGELVAVDPSGRIKWRHAVTSEGNPDHPGMITGAPAVGNDGNVYIITTVDVMMQNRRDDLSRMIRVRRSSLHSFTPSGNHRWSYRFPANTLDRGLGAFTTSSPKIWSEQNTFIFVPAIYLSKMMYKVEILVINQSGNLVNQTEVANYTESSLDRHILEALSVSWDVMKCSKSHPEPALAIADIDSRNQQPLIIIDDNYKTMTAYRWHFPVLATLWSNHSEKIRQHTSPSVYPSNRILFGSKEGMVYCYDLNNGTEQFCYQADHLVLNPPVFHGNNIYFIAGSEVTMLDAGFNIKNRCVLSATCVNSLALSENHIYVSTEAGFYTLSLNLENLNRNASIVGGVSSPAISHDGTVYVVDQDGRLFAI